MNEPLQKTGKHILLEAGQGCYVAIPIDVFIELDGDIPILQTIQVDGKESLTPVQTPTVFKLMTGEQMDTLLGK